MDFKPFLAQDAEPDDERRVIGVKQQPSRSNLWVMTVNGNVLGDSPAFETRRQAEEHARSWYSRWPRELVTFTF